MTGEQKFLKYATIGFLTFFAIFVVIILFSIFTSSDNTENEEVEYGRQATLYDSIEDNKEETNDTNEEEIISDETTSRNAYPAGSYKVGVDIPAGTYLIFDSDYVAVLSDSSGELGSIIENEGGETLLRYVSVNDGEYLNVKSAYLTTEKGETIIYPEDGTPPLELNTYFAGTYKVGKDIPAGEYKVELIEGEDSGYWERNSAPIGSNSKIIANDYFTEDSVYVTIQDGEYLRLSGGAKIVKNE